MPSVLQERVIMLSSMVAVCHCYIGIKGIDTCGARIMHDRLIEDQRRS